MPAKNNSAEGKHSFRFEGSFSLTTSARDTIRVSISPHGGEDSVRRLIHRVTEAVFIVTGSAELPRTLAADILRHVEELEAEKAEEENNGKGKKRTNIPE